MKWTLQIKDQDGWEAVCAKGHTRWVLINGAFGHGLPLFLLIALFSVDIWLLDAKAATNPAGWVVFGLIALSLTFCIGYIAADVAWHKWADK